jgi:flagellar basal body P-ring formation protein FlgA
MGRCEGIVGSVFQNISANRPPFRVHFRATRKGSAPYIGSVDTSLFALLRRAFFLCLAAAAGLAHAQAAQDAWIEQGRQFAAAELARSGQARTEVLPGRLDARLRLPPCEEVKPFLPNGTRLWGKTRVGLRCVKGVTNWNVYLPLTVNVYGPALVSRSALPAGHVLGAADVHQAEVNLAEDMNDAVLTDASAALGRSLSRPLAPGQPLRRAALKARQWFAAGDKVQIRVAGSGFAVAGAGEAVTAGMEGLPARVRTDSGRVVSGMPVGERVLEITL